MADAPIPAPAARLSRGRASVVGGRLVLIVALIAGVALVASVALLPVVVPAGELARDTANKLVDVPPLKDALPDPAQRSVIYAADGKTALATIWLDENRRVIPLRDVPERVRDAVVAIEDDRFYQHDGVDFRGIARAAVADLRSGRYAQGGSTLTQQLVKQTVTGNSRTIDRKLREAIYAVELEKRYSKDEILQYYLNQAYFGEGVYGVATAAQHYFGNKSIGNVSLSEAASLAATIAAPERYKPTSRKANLARRNLVLDRMRELGYVTSRQVAKAKREKLKIERYKPPSRQPYFQAYIVNQLLNDPKYNKALGKVGSDERKRKVFQGGLRIYTTLQRPRQAMAANAVQGQMDQFRGDPAGALASVEPGTGRIVALYGGRSFKKSQVDLATAQGGTGFQPGSAFKMFFVVAALEAGISPGIVMQGPARITIPNRRCYTGYNQPWTPGNAGDSSAGVYNMYGAVANSVNTWFAQLAVKVGPERAVEVARRMGITNIPPRNSKAYASWNVCSLVLGAREVSVLDMAGAFGVLANKGVRCAPYSITKVVAPGERQPLIDNKPDCKRVISEKISTRTVAMLRGVITHGTGHRAALGGRPVAGKTGSAQNNTSAFFSGFTPQLSTSVWVGYRARRVPMRNLFYGGPVYGGTFPALIFHNYMEAALAGLPAVGFPAAPPPPPPPRQREPKERPKPPKPPTPPKPPKPGKPRHPNVIVPGVVGLPVGTARLLLTASGLSPGTAYTTTGGQPGRVAAQSPGAGAQLPGGSRVTLVVSRRT